MSYIYDLQTAWISASTVYQGIAIDLTNGTAGGAPVYNAAGTYALNIKKQGVTVFGVLPTGFLGVNLGGASPNAPMQLGRDSSIYWGGQQFTISGSTNALKQLAIGFNTTANQGFMQAGISGTGFSPLVLQPNGAQFTVGAQTPATNITSTFKANDSNPYILGAVDSADRIVMQLDGFGRFDCTSYSAGGAAAGPPFVLKYINAVPVNGDTLGHYAFQGNDNSGQANTFAYFLAYATDVSSVSMDSKIRLGWMTAVVGVPATVQQPNTFIDIDTASGMLIPSINASGFLNVSMESLTTYRAGTDGDYLAGRFENNTQASANTAVSMALYVDANEKVRFKAGRDGGNTSATFELLTRRAGVMSTFMYTDINGNLGLNTQLYGTNAASVLVMANATAPISSPVGVGQIYVEAGALKFRGSGGTVTSLAAA